jgi:hypothetical protein
MMQSAKWQREEIDYSCGDSKEERCGLGSQEGVEEGREIKRKINSWGELERK